MKTSISLKCKNEKILYGLLFLLTLSTYLHKYFVYLGFAFKPYMAALALVIYTYILFNLKVYIKILFYEKLFLIFLSYSFIRGIFSYDTDMFLRMAINLVIVCILYFSISNLVYRLDKKAVTKILYSSGLIFVVISLMLYVLGNERNQLGGTYEGPIYRLTGTIVDPNIFGIFVSLIYGLSLYGVSLKKKKYYLSLFLSVIAIVLTFSRGTILGILFSTVVFSISFKLLTIKRSLNIILILMTLVFIFIYIGEDIILEKMGMSFFEIVEMRMEDTTGTGRLIIWRNGLKLFEDNPLFGVGLYNFQSYNTRFFHNNFFAHNTFLEVFVENGLIGGFLFLGSLIIFFLMKSSNDEEKILKGVIYTQLFMLLFLTGISNEFVYLTLGIYKGFVMKHKCEC